MVKNEKKEYAAFAVGFFLIIFVIVFTLFRNNPFSKEAPVIQKINQQKTENAAAPYQQTISAKDLQKKILTKEEKSGIVLLDIRPFEEYAKEHIIDAVNIPLDEFPVASKIDAHSLVVVVGSNSTDGDIQKAVEKLKQENFKNIKVLANGMDAWISFVGVTVTYGDPTSFVDQSKVSYIDQEKLKEDIDKNIHVSILDVRSSEEYAQGHIPGAKNIPFEELEKRRGEISEKKIVVVGINELQEFQASVQLADMILASPSVLQDAMPKWEEKGFPIVK